MTLTVRNPATGAVLAELPEADAAGVHKAIAAARAAQPAWGARPLRERARTIDRFRRLLLDDRRGMAETISREVGKPVAEALGVDVLITLDAARWLTRDGVRILEPERIALGNPLFAGRRSYLEHLPVGVVGVVSPWNYPLAIPATNVLYALVAGNAVVLKPASLAPLTALRFQDLLHQAGVPKEVSQTVVGSGQVAGHALVEGAIDHLVFTGSVPTGKAVEARLKARSVRSCMELGGSDPAIVLADVDLARAVEGILWGRFTNAGQTCAATKRVYVHRSIHDRFVEELGRRASMLRLGDPLASTTDVGPLTDPKGVAEMTAFVDDAKRKGARVVAGGRARPDLGPRFFEPTVLADVPAEARVLREETFGPVLPVLAFDLEEEAVRRANATSFGLSASVWTRDLRHGRDVARRIEAGTVTVNDVAYTYAANATPWGGFKDSGHGRTHGRWGLLELTEARHVNLVPARRLVGRGWWFPYGERLEGFFDHGVQWLYGGFGRRVRTTLPMAADLARRRRAR